MEEDFDDISYSSVESFGMKQPEIEFKPKSTTNYFPTIFDTTLSKRLIFGEGALPLHEISLFLYDFIEQYINEATVNEIYMLSGITQTTDGQSFYHLLKLEGQHTRIKRIEQLLEQLPKLYEDLEQKAFGMFLTKKNKSKRYRLDTDINVLKKSYAIYLKDKQRITELTKTLSMSISTYD